MYLLTNVITMLMIPMQQAFSASMFRVYKCACVTKFHVAQLMNTLMKMHPIRDPIFVVVETLFFHSI